MQGAAPVWGFSGGSIAERDKVPHCLGSDVAAESLRSVSAVSPWFALQVRARHETGVANFLSGRGYEPFVPMYQGRRRWSDRIKVVDTPLFPGYLFCRFDINNRLPILTTPGVIQVVGFNRTPVPVDDSEIGAIQNLVTSGFPSQPWPFLQAGDRVQIESGPLRGLEGLLVELKGSHRLIVSVTLLQRSVAVEIDSALVKALRSAPAKHAQAKARAWQLAT
ncbi:MAG TPA: UpxY family transcription antiterminator [Candidatus Dormibacteraeota bacterium]|nr:UpxY family transcription antiterminator [Candidatus Dormibacteraeota bacterium]